ncbi:hypothetical protein JB92DRAFT_3102092 [Gautieria morchelliformis]|nr:hypothetical protein JB92DRAFT_3102092 [Gautieria morchelliformis]
MPWCVLIQFCVFRAQASGLGFVSGALIPALKPGLLTRSPAPLWIVVSSCRRAEFETARRVQRQLSSLSVANWLILLAVGISGAVIRRWSRSKRAFRPGAASFARGGKPLADAAGAGVAYLGVGEDIRRCGTWSAGAGTLPINRAKGAELDHWISQLNTLSSAQDGQKRKLLTKQGTVDARRRKIAHFLGIDLTQTTSDPPVAGPLTVDKAIGKEQWAWARTLAQEWAEAEAAGVSFKLWRQSEYIEVMARTEGLREVLEQVQSGLVQRLRDRYGPGKDKKADPLWATLGQQISRRERLARDFESEFQGDMDRFLGFFTYTSSVRRKVEVKTRSMRLLVTKDIPNRTKCLEQEQQQECYRDEKGVFSKEKWLERWGSKNKWDIYYELEPKAREWN